MSEQNAGRYTFVAITLHWVIALLIIGQLAGGLFMVNLSDEQASLKFELFQWHKSFGITILLLSFVRLLWRLGHRPPALPSAMATWERIAARGAHFLFYVLMIAMPLGGWAVVSSSPYAGSVPTFLFGVVHWPHLPFFDAVADKAALSEQLAGYHELGAYAMIGLLVLHIGAALQHHFLKKDGVLSSMAPFVRRRPS